MYYYRLAVNSSWYSSSGRFAISEITTTVQNANLALVGVSQCLGGFNGTDCFNLAKNYLIWNCTQTTYVPPAYMIFSSNVLLSNLTIQWSNYLYAPKNITISVSNSLLSYTDPNWRLKVNSDAADRYAMSKIFYMSNSKSLIKQNGLYYSTAYSQYDTSAKTYIPLTLAGGAAPNTTDIVQYAMDDIGMATAITTINGETFRPIDKLGVNFNVMVYKPK